MNSIELEKACYIKKQASLLPYTKEQLSWRYAVWNNENTRVIGVKDITGRIMEPYKYG